MLEPAGPYLVAALLAGADRIAGTLIGALLAVLATYLVLAAIVATTVHLAERPYPRHRPPR